MNADERTDSELLEATATGDDAAFAVLVRRYVRAATLLAAEVVGNRDEAEEVTQDAFLVVYRDARRFDNERPFAPWLFAIVRRLAANRRSRQARRARLLQVWGWVTHTFSRSSRPDAALNARLDAAKVRHAMESLPPMQQRCFDLVVIHGFTPRDVAEMHGITESTVRQHVFRARATLQDRLRDRSGERR